LSLKDPGIVGQKVLVGIERHHGGERRVGRIRENNRATIRMVGSTLAHREVVISDSTHRNETRIRLRCLPTMSVMMIRTTKVETGKGNDSNGTAVTAMDTGKTSENNEVAPDLAEETTKAARIVEIRADGRARARGIFVANWPSPKMVAWNNNNEVLLVLIETLERTTITYKPVGVLQAINESVEMKTIAPIGLYEVKLGTIEPIGLHEVNEVRDLPRDPMRTTAPIGLQEMNEDMNLARKPTRTTAPIGLQGMGEAMDSKTREPAITTVSILAQEDLNKTRKGSLPLNCRLATTTNARKSSAGPYK
jgi:hypothetical protein